MPEANLEAFALEGKSPSELEQRRAAIVSQYLGKNLDDMTIPHLQELAALTSALRRRTAGGAPKSTSRVKAKAKPKSASLDDLEALL